jgi:hypothetical protein
MTHNDQHGAVQQDFTSHYEITEWVDFARDLVSEENAIRMREHLAAGCSPCREVVDFCHKLAHTCRSMASYRAPDSAVRLARAVFPMPQRAERKQPFRIPIELVFDSFLAPAPAGMRSAWQAGWQALYHAGDCALDLKAEPEVESPQAAVIGQISKRTAPETDMADLLVCLKAGHAVVAETRSNRFGEFQMEYQQQDGLQLWIYLEGGSSCIQIPIQKFAEESPRPWNQSKPGKSAGKQRSETGREN